MVIGCTKSGKLVIHGARDVLVESVSGRLSKVIFSEFANANALRTWLWAHNPYLILRDLCYSSVGSTSQSKYGNHHRRNHHPTYRHGRVAKISSKSCLDTREPTVCFLDQPDARTLCPQAETMGGPDANCRDRGRTGLVGG